MGCFFLLSVAIWIGYRCTKNVCHQQRTIYAVVHLFRLLIYNETVDDSALGNIVNAALAQRGKSGSDLSSSTEFGNVGLVTLDSQEDQAENFYNYEGKDFTKVREYVQVSLMFRCILIHAYLK